MAIVIREFTLTATDVVGSTASVPVDVRGCDKFSIQAVIDENTDSAKTFDSGVDASFVAQNLTYTAVTRGTSGNSINIQTIDSGEALQPLTINVVGNTISVLLELDGSAPPARLVGPSVT